MTQPAIDLNNMIDTRPKPDPVWVAYPGSKTFQVLVRFLGNRNQEFIKAAQEVVWDKGTMTRIVEMNPDTYAKLFCDFVIVDWRGLTFKDLRILVLIENIKEARKQLKGDIPCDEGSKLLLFKNSPSFNAWIRAVSKDVETFNEQREQAAEKKPLRQSSTASTTQA